MLAIPLGLDLYMPVPEDNPLTAEKIELGRRLFFDRRLSRDGTIACASCHDPERAFSDGRPLAVGVFGRAGRRNAPALINRGYGRAFFWDGRIATLEEQVLKPIQDPNEMDLTLARGLSARVACASPTISRALASYVRSHLSGNSPFDRFINGDRDGADGRAAAGLQIFRGKGNCTACHVGPKFSDERFHNTGVAWRDGRLQRRGPRRTIAARSRRRRCAKSRAPRPTCTTAACPRSSVVDFYARRRPARIRPRSRDPAAAADRRRRRQLVAFLRALSGDVQSGLAGREHRPPLRPHQDRADGPTGARFTETTRFRHARGIGGRVNWRALRHARGRLPSTPPPGGAKSSP